MTGFRTGLLIGALAVAVIGLGLALILNSDDGDGDGTTTEIAAATTAPTTTDETTATDETTTASGEAAFTSPSGNIVCRVTAEAATCGILQFTYTPPPDTAGCGSERWGHAVTVEGSDAGTFVCSNDPPANFDEPALAYGDRLTLGPFRCDSAEAGLLCENPDSGHGFAISREQARTF